MKKQTLIIVDSDSSLRQQLIDYIKRSDYPAVFLECCNGVEALRYINSLQPDAVFLDVQLPGLNGFEILDRLECSPSIILTSCCTSHAARAFEYDVVDYLPKPFTLQRLQITLQKLAGQREISSEVHCKAHSYPRHILLEKGNRLTKIPIAEIAYLKADKDYCWVHTVSGETFLSNYGIGKLISRLDPHQFIRIHRSYVINLDYIDGCYKDISRLFITLPNNVELNVGRSYLPTIKELIF
ncbi:LytR/AlgR family response regulator transcription factor [Sphingobacterium thalpophilum]|uniref:LytR/AlgR family response regulator transcription factor n=1 Tax=Sphingobacterium thalpophilum TaxID=259 RepID=UPI0037DA7499